ncbi:hypothetical protein G5I_05090 [Acromyrmex echinatior]|uniref:Uncharacterized protein n=1 Tax=Acromyrmex echinatior TaxID=103372 RepID=F4WHD0_ACREC|nr:hypothetical protein G5I_05090 [Acromyrmex echinatior]
MGTHQVRWMALDHKYGSWFDYMEPHVKPTTLAQPFSTTYTISFPPPSPSGRMSHISANVAAFYLPLVTATLLYPNRGEPRIEIPPLLFFYFSRTRKVTNEATGRDASTRVHLNLKIEHASLHETAKLDGKLENSVRGLNPMSRVQPTSARVGNGAEFNNPSNNPVDPATQR